MQQYSKDLLPTWPSFHLTRKCKEADLFQFSPKNKMQVRHTVPYWRLYACIKHQHSDVLWKMQVLKRYKIMFFKKHQPWLQSSALLKPETRWTGKYMTKKCGFWTSHWIIFLNVKPFTDSCNPLGSYKRPCQQQPSGSLQWWTFLSPNLRRICTLHGYKLWCFHHHILLMHGQQPWSTRLQ